MTNKRLELFAYVALALGALASLGHAWMYRVPSAEGGIASAIVLITLVTTPYALAAAATRWTRKSRSATRWRAIAWSFGVVLSVGLTASVVSLNSGEWVFT